MNKNRIIQNIHEKFQNQSRLWTNLYIFISYFCHKSKLNKWVKQTNSVLKMSQYC